LDDGTAYAVGLAGVVLCFKDGHWKTIDHQSTDSDFWGMTVFQDNVYLSSYEGLYRINGDELFSVDMGLSPSPTTAYLHANDGVMWSVGQKDIACTEDALTWSTIENPN